MERAIFQILANLVCVLKILGNQCYKTVWKLVSLLYPESGETSNIEIVQKLKEKGCPVIAITNTLESTLSRLSDCSITHHVPSIIFKWV